jgi:hypothetical protein
MELHKKRQQSVLSLAISHLPLKPAAHKLKKIWSTTICSFKRAITPDRLHMESWYLSAAMLLRVLDLVFYKDIISQ